MVTWCRLSVPDVEQERVNKKLEEVTLLFTHLQCSIRAARHHDIVCHLTGPDSARVTHQCSETLARHSGPDLQRVVVTSADNSVSGELETRDHVVVVTLEHLGRSHGLDPPVHLNIVLPHETGLPWGVDEPGANFTTFSQKLPTISETRFFTLFPPQQVILR